MEIVQTHLLTIAIIILIVLVVVAGSSIALIVKQKLTELGNKTSLELSKEMIAQAKIIVSDVVKSLNSSLVEDLKDKAADGKLTKEEAVEIFNKAFTTIKSIYTDDMQKIMSSFVGNIDQWISTQIEIVVGNLSNERKNNNQIKENHYIGYK